jgi:prepilin-type N-terminal cleavage/methylation domain-containing protein
MDKLMNTGRVLVQRDQTSTRTSGGGVLCLSHRPYQRRCRRRHSGFTLLETMIAMSLLAIGTLGVAGSMVTSLKTTRESRSRTYASYLAAQQMEIFHLMTTAEINAALADPSYPNDPAGPIDPDPNDGDPTTFTRSWQILPDDPEPGVFRLTVMVGFTNKLGTPQVERIQLLKDAI